MIDETAKDSTPAEPVDGSPEQFENPSNDIPQTSSVENEDPEVSEEDGDPSVPSDLLELHVELEEKGVSVDDFQEAYGNEQEDDD